MSVDPALRLYLKRIGPQHLATMSRFPGVLQQDWREAQGFMEDGLLVPPIHRRMLYAEGRDTRVLVSPGLRSATVLDSVLPDTVLVAVVGMRAGNVLDHPAFDEGRPGAEAIVTGARLIDPQHEGRRWSRGEPIAADATCIRMDFDRAVLDMAEIMEEDE